jgi:methylmalonyl-CoA mutase
LIQSGTAARWNELAREQLQGGADAVGIVLDEASARGKDPDVDAADLVGVGGLPLSAAADIEEALAELPLDHLALEIDARAVAPSMAALLGSVLGRPQVALRGMLHYDPLGHLVRCGRLQAPLPTLLDRMADLMSWCESDAPDVTPVLAHGDVYEEAAAGPAQELAFTVATATDYLREMVERGLEPGLAARRIALELRTGTRFFVDLAKLRAARILWSGVVEAFEGASGGWTPAIHSRTSGWRVAARDPWTNLLRTTIGAFAAVAGGADGIVVEPFDVALGAPDSFAYRLARNTQILLREECHLHRVVDAGGGSWFIERLTEDLARRAWTLFQEIERRGGMGAAVLSGFPQDDVLRVAERQREAVARRRERFVGVSGYVDLGEERPARGPILSAAEAEHLAATYRERRAVADGAERDAALDELRGTRTGGGDWIRAATAAVQAGATLGDLEAPEGKEEARTTRLPCWRGPAAFERLRDAADAHATVDGAPLRALLALVGSPAKLRARLDFTLGLVEAGGVTVFRDEPPVRRGATDIAARAVEHDVPVVLVCGADADYPGVVPEIARELRRAGSGARLVVAGPPPGDADWVADVFLFIYAGCDVLAALEQVQRAAGVVHREEVIA